MLLIEFLNIKKKMKCEVNRVKIKRPELGPGVKIKRPELGPESDIYNIF